MSPRRIAVGRAGAIRVAIALLVGSACLGAVAYAAAGSGNREIGVAGRQLAAGEKPQGGSAQQGGGEQTPRVRLIEAPAASSTVVDPQFRFHVPPRAKEAEEPAAPVGPGSGEAAPRRRFQCRLDGGRWTACSSPYRLTGLVPGEYAFAVRALSRKGRPGPDVAYGWQVVAPASVAVEVVAQGKPFSIEQTGSLAPLYPGEPAQPVPLTIGNPNSTPIEVTSLTVVLGSSAAGCAAENFELTASSASPATPLVVPAEGTVDLPATGITAPSISLLDLPVNQDACQGAELELALSGEARG